MELSSRSSFIYMPSCEKNNCSSHVQYFKKSNIGKYLRSQGKSEREKKKSHQRDSFRLQSTIVVWFLLLKELEVHYHRSGVVKFSLYYIITRTFCREQKMDARSSICLWQLPRNSHVNIVNVSHICRKCQKAFATLWHNLYNPLPCGAETLHLHCYCNMAYLWRHPSNKLRIKN